MRIDVERLQKGFEIAAMAAVFQLHFAAFEAFDQSRHPVVRRRFAVADQIVLAADIRLGEYGGSHCQQDQQGQPAGKATKGQ